MVTITMVHSEKQGKKSEIDCTKEKYFDVNVDQIIFVYDY